MVWHEKREMLPEKLHGKELLDQVAAMKDVVPAELVRVCGYVLQTRSGHERLDYSGFHKALLSAKRADPFTAVEVADPDADEPVSAEVLVDGFMRLRLPEGFSASASGWYGLRVHSWDLYYPGSPMSIVALADQASGDSGYRSVFESHLPGELMVVADVLRCGQRYVHEPNEGLDADPPALYLEPYPWNGIEADLNEHLRLLLIPESDVCALLQLAIAEMPGQLYDDGAYDDLEEAIAEGLWLAVEACVAGNPDVRSLFARHRLSLDSARLSAWLQSAWLDPIDRRFQELQSLRSVLLRCLARLDSA